MIANPGDYYFCSQIIVMASDLFNRAFFLSGSYVLLGTGIVIILFFQLKFYLRLVLLKNKKEESFPPQSLSLLLSVRNEQDRIEKVLLQLLNQNFPDFEVVVVDDFSEDATAVILGALAERYPQLKVRSLNQETRYSEKLSVNLALKAASYGWVLFVSPDTEDIPPDFLQQLSGQISEKESLNLNYVNFRPQRGRYNKLCRIERFFSFMQSAAYSLSGVPVFFQQINILFPREFYFRSNGFRKKLNYHFANMELVFNHLKKPTVSVSLNAETNLREKVVLTRTDYNEVIRKRILLKKDLVWWKKLIMRIEYLSVFLALLGTGGLLILNPQRWYYYIIPVFVVFFIQVFIIKSLQNHLNEKKIFLSSLMYLVVKPIISFYHETLIYIHMQRSKWI